jgi:hypothetical protein
MSNPANSIVHEPSAIDDLRLIRRRFDRESQGDIRKHVAESNRVAAQLKEVLGLKTVPSRTPATFATHHPG